MAERRFERPSLFSFAVGSFHAALLVALGVAGLHLSGAAGDLLGGVGTLPGAVAYLALWVLTVWTTDRALTASGVTPVEGVPDRRRALRAALTWGAVTGGVFFAALFVVVLVAALVVVGPEALTLVLIGGAVGSVFALVVGALVGGLFALADVGLLRVAVALTGERRPLEATDERAEDPDVG